RERELVGEMARERGLGRDKSFEIVVAAIASAGADAGPLRIAGRIGGARRWLRRWRRVVGKHVVEVGVEPILDGGAARFQLLVRPIAGLRIAGLRIAGERLGGR